MTITDVRLDETVRQMLADARAMVDPALRAAVGRLSDPVRRASGYHFGWLDRHGDPVAAAPGKAIRPALTLLSAAAVGGDARAAVPAAVAVELVHNFSLLHDDVMDGDHVRRHRPAVWSVYGVPTAVLVGDALLALAMNVLTDSGNPVAQDGMRMLSTAVGQVVHGQSADLDFEARADVDVPECIAMTFGKTAALLGCSCALGALFGGGGSEKVDCLRGFGEQLGLAFQIVDDLLGIWGDPAVTGKPAGSDLANRKKSLPVVAAIASGCGAAQELAALYRLDRPLTGAELDRATSLVDCAGGRAWAKDQADHYLADALAQLHATLAPPATVQLEAISRMVIRRER